MRARLTLLVWFVALLAGCSSDDDRGVVINNPTAPTPPPVVINTIEFRVVGNASSVRIRHVNPVDGLSQVSTVLPFVVSLRTDQAAMFLSLEVLPLSYPPGLLFPFLSVQIFVNGVLFREGSSADLLMLPISVSGTWRR